MMKFFMIAFLSCIVVRDTAAQNLLKHYPESSFGIRYEQATNQYVVNGIIAPTLLSGMDNTGPAGPIRRIQLRLLDDQLNTLWLNTYATQTEVSRAISVQGSCRKLTNAFYATDAIRTADGGYLVCGMSAQDMEISGCSGIPVFHNPFLLKTNSTGGVMWYKRYAVEGAFSAVVEDQSTGRLIACGGTQSREGLIICTDPTGNIFWSRGVLGRHPTIPGTTLSTSYDRIVPFTTSSGQFRYALAGNADQDGMGVDGGILISLIDINGSFYRDAVLNQNAFYSFPRCDDMADAGDGKLVITGASIDASGGYPCGADNGTLTLLKIDPETFVVDFFKAYHKYTGASGGNGVAVWHNGPVTKYCITGTHNTGAVYLETDDNGNPMRYTPHNPADAYSGGSMTINTLSNYPAYSGGYPGGTFVIRNNYGVDCAADIPVATEDLPYGMQLADHYNMPVAAIAEVMLQYTFPYIEFDACGVLKPGTTDIYDIRNKTGLQLSPNPGHDYLDVQVAAKADMIYTMRIYDMTGRILWQESARGTNARIPIRDLTPGAYILHVEDKDGRVQYTRFVKQ